MPLKGGRPTYHSMPGRRIYHINGFARVRMPREPDRDLMHFPIPLSEVKSYADYLIEQKVQPWEEFKPVGSR